ncbi:hypothetical protein COCNU_07G001900 [Cocos nucifera]|uniref:Uncharacterized protein n=1 Tax=Cocos nucifera TaxID=13894 RepID=A0A8K0N478_COCNU|nr:hypothetical protein COCNU_07G001900 [Cocos nucifera]
MIPSLRRRQGVVSCKWVVVVFLVQIIFLHSTINVPEGSRSSTFLDWAPISAIPSGSVMFAGHDNHENEDDLVGADKRKIPTGANPLHNR